MKGYKIVPNDIVNIVRKLVYEERIKTCNREYYEEFQQDSNNAICPKINNYFSINLRNLNSLSYRKIIVCFKKGKTTIFRVPKNY